MSGPDDRLRLRLASTGLIVLLLFGVLFTRLWFLQILAGDRYTLAAERNHVRLVSIQAPRGRILDRDGKVLVENRPALAVGIRKDDLPRDPRQVRDLKRRLSALIDVPLREIERRLADRRSSPYAPVVVAEDVTQDVIFAVRERAAEFPGVETLSVPVRTYPLGPIAAHVIGYVGETTEAELEALEGYRLGDSIGRTGLERTYERWLRGRAGLEKLEVDARGRVIRSLGSLAPQPGSDLILSIDADVQRAAEAALEAGVRRARTQVFRETGQRFRAPAGGVVVLDARDGGVVAMASHPTFDLRRFVGGVDGAYWQRLNDPSNHYPLLNRAAQASYPPGSTFKPLVVTAALATGIASPGSYLPCLTQFHFGDRVFRNWRPRNENISLAQALIESCDTPFYKLGVRWWTDEVNALNGGRTVTEHMQEWAKRFGLGATTGIDLPQEAEGFIPGRDTRRAAWERNKESWCRQARRTGSALYDDLCRYGHLWRGGDAVNMSIGQGEVQASPLQMAAAYGAIATGGSLWEPHLARRIVSPQGDLIRRIEPEVRTRVRAKGSIWRYVQNALARVPKQGGTAYYPFAIGVPWPLDDIPVAAKTGSAEIAGKQPFSWFAAYAPADRPRYVAVAVVEEAGFGSQVAGPVVRRVMDELFDLPRTAVTFGLTRSD